MFGRSTSQLPTIVCLDPYQYSASWLTNTADKEGPVESRFSISSNRSSYHVTFSFSHGGAVGLTSLVSFPSGVDCSWERRSLLDLAGNPSSPALSTSDDEDDVGAANCFQLKGRKSGLDSQTSPRSGSIPKHAFDSLQRKSDRNTYFVLVLLTLSSTSFLCFLSFLSNNTFPRSYIHDGLRPQLPVEPRRGQDLPHPPQPRRRLCCKDPRRISRARHRGHR